MLNTYNARFNATFSLLEKSRTTLSRIFSHKTHSLKPFSTRKIYVTHTFSQTMMFSTKFLSFILLWWKTFTMSILFLWNDDITYVSFSLLSFRLVSSVSLCSILKFPKFYFLFLYRDPSSIIILKKRYGKKKSLFLLFKSETFFVELINCLRG